MHALLRVAQTDTSRRCRRSRYEVSALLRLAMHPPGSPLATSGIVQHPPRPMKRAGVSLRLRLTAVCVTLAAVVSALLLWLGWLLVGEVVRAVPALPSGTTVRVGELTVPADQLGEALSEAARAEVLRAGLIAFPLVVAAAGLVSWLVVGRVLRPLRQVTSTARRLSAESLDERIALQGSSGEVAELVQVFDAMLDRLQASFEAQRRFVANASHELRTPLSVMRTEIDVTMADPESDVGELRRMATVLRDATRRTDELLAGLLLLARSQAAVAANGAAKEQVDLATLVGPAVDAVRTEAAACLLRIDVDARPASTRGDRALLERVVGNLVENGVRHNVPEGWLEITTGTDAGWASLVVRSSGAVVGAEQVPELFEPFRRGLPERTGHRGAGLGLSIVRAVVLAHGGQVHGEPVDGGGLAVTVQLPVAGAR